MTDKEIIICIVEFYSVLHIGEAIIIRDFVIAFHKCCQFDFALDLWEGMSDALNFNVMFSPRGALFLGHSDGDMTALAQRGAEPSSMIFGRL